MARLPRLFAMLLVAAFGAAWAVAPEAPIALKPPAATPEPFGEHDDFPWLPRLPGSPAPEVENVPEGLDVTTSDDADARIVGTSRMSRRYPAPPGLDADAIVRTYASALHGAGWVLTMQQANAPGGALVVAHYAAAGRDVWARIAAAAGHYTLAAADAGAGVAHAFESGCVLVANGIAFGLDDAALLPASEPTLAQLQRLLKSQPALDIEIEAHTDPHDANGDREAGLRLSTQRAEAVRLWLRQHRIDADRIAAARGLGDSAPLHASDTAENRARNRRVEIRKAGCR